jgi:hypothetical protein
MRIVRPAVERLLDLQPGQRVVAVAGGNGALTGRSRFQDTPPFLVARARLLAAGG